MCNLVNEKSDGLRHVKTTCAAVVLLTDLINSAKEDVEAGWYNSPSPVSYIIREDVEATNQ